MCFATLLAKTELLPPLPLPQHLLQIVPRMRPCRIRHFLWRALRDQVSPILTTFWPHIDEVVGALQHIKIVFDDDY
jgi:hypothetical protein